MGEPASEAATYPEFRGCVRHDTAACAASKQIFANLRER